MSPHHHLSNNKKRIQNTFRLDRVCSFQNFNMSPTKITLSKNSQKENYG